MPFSVFVKATQMTGIYNGFGKLSDPFTCCSPKQHDTATTMLHRSYSNRRVMSTTYFSPDAALGVQIKLFSL